MEKLRRVYWVFRNDGVWVGVVFVFLRSSAVFLGSERAARVVKFFAGFWFDKHHNIETSIEMDRFDLDVPEVRRQSARSYVPTPPHVFRAIIRQLPIDPSGYSFVDYGSGKGRVLLLAAQLSFQRIYGVELSPALVAACRRNLVNCRGFRGVERVEAVCGDALDFALPPGDLVLFFYNPFDKEIMAAIVRNIEASLDPEPRQIHLVYWHPFDSAALDESNVFAKVRENRTYPWYAIYTNTPGAYSVT